MRDSFRNDINGLRAWAVGLVVLYHFEVPGFGGGYLGVDVFFVISGFLMTRIIMNGLARESEGRVFSVIDFYLARAKRILPALAAMCLAMLVVGYFWLPASDFRQLGIHAATAVTFTSNIKFFLESGYFTEAARDIWLLHTWSLSVEWQFYILLPVALVLVWRLRQSMSFVLGALVVMMIGSFALSALATPNHASASFFLLPTRAWEMIAGGLAFFLPLRASISSSIRRSLELIGIGLIGASAFAVDGHSEWPGVLAAIPVVGTVLVLLAAREDSGFTASAFAQWLGRISYSVYLWHWPVMVLMEYAGNLDSNLAIILGIGLSLVAGHISWALVEEPSRRRLGGRARMGVLAASSVIAAFVLLPASYVYLKQGLPGRLGVEAEAIFAEAKNRNPRAAECHVGPPRTVPECLYGTGSVAAVVLGDSHAASLTRTIDLAVESGQVLALTYAGCPTLLDARKVQEQTGGRNSDCRQFTKHAIEKIKQFPGVPVFIVNRTSAYAFGFNELQAAMRPGKPLIFYDGALEEPNSEFLQAFKDDLIRTACSVSETNPTFMLRPIPEPRVNVPRMMGRSVLFGEGQRVWISVREYEERHRFVLDAQDAASKECGIQILDPFPYLCDAERCWGDVDGMPVYFDDHHLNERGGQLLLPLFRSAMDASRNSTELSRDAQGELQSGK